MKVLIFKVSPIGDTIVFLPVVQAMRRMFPELEIAVITSPATAPFFRTCLESENIWTEERSALHKAWRRPALLLRWILRVRRFKPDAVLLSFDQSSVARLLAVASGARKRIGGTGATVRLRGGLTHEVVHNPGDSLAQWDWEMARVLLGEEWPAKTSIPQLGIARPLRHEGRLRVLVHAGASRAYQHWPSDRYAELSKRLTTSFEVIWIRYPGSPGVEPDGPVRIEEPGNLRELAELAASADLFVGNHSGAFHIATAVGTPCIIPTGPALTVCDPPWGSNRMLRRTGLACMPCDGLVASANRCLNLETPMACLNYWTVDAVEAICREALAKSS